jgi:hypothetical protein
MVFAQFERRFEGNQHTMARRVPDELLDNKILLSKNLLGIVVAHCVVG